VEGMQAGKAEMVAKERRVGSWCSWPGWIVPRNEQYDRVFVKSSASLGDADLDINIAVKRPFVLRSRSFMVTGVIRCLSLDSVHRQGLRSRPCGFGIR
jgi:hypothetical protein